MRTGACATSSPGTTIFPIKSLFSFFANSMQDAFANRRTCFLSG
jgi:hypothetical protein